MRHSLADVTGGAMGRGRRVRQAKGVHKELEGDNDVAERDVKLMQDFIGSVTKDEQQLQDVMQLVENHRKQVGSFKKSALMML